MVSFNPIESRDTSSDADVSKSQKKRHPTTWTGRTRFYVNLESMSEGGLTVS